MNSIRRLLPTRVWAALLVLIALMATTLSLTATPAAAQQNVTSDPNAPVFEKADMAPDTVNECIAEDPVNNIIYACHYRGMMKSLDGGVTWQRAGSFSLSPLAPFGGLELRHYLTAAVASDGTVFVGNDQTNGASWSSHRTGQVRMSTDFGETWQTITPVSNHAHVLRINSAVLDVIVDTENPDPAHRDLVYYCSANRVYRSLDTNHVVDPEWSNVDANGNPIGPQPEIKWVQIGPNASATNPGGGFAPANPAHRCREMTIHNGSLYVLTNEGIWRSDNYDQPLPQGGPPDSSSIIWTLITPTSLNSIGVAAMEFDAAGTLFVGSGFGSSSDHGLYSSANPAAATPTFTRLHHRTAFAMHLANDGSLVTARRHGAGLEQFWVDRAATPGVVPTIALDTQNARVEDFTTLADGTLLASSWGMGILRSTDNGQTWQQSNQGQHFFQRPTAVDNSGRIYTTGTTGLLYSDDDGGSFHHCGRFHAGNSFLREARAPSVRLADNGDIYALLNHPSGMSGLWKSTDRCASFSQVATSPTNEGAIMNGHKLTLGVNNQTMLAVFGSSALHRSTDGGVTWTDISQQLVLPPGAVHTYFPITNIQKAPNGEIWMIAGYDEIYRSSDDGATWSPRISLPQVLPIPSGGVHQGFAFAANGDVFVASQRGVFVVRSGSSVLESTGLDGTGSTIYGISSVAIDSTGRLLATSANTRDRSVLGVYASDDGGTTWVHEPNSVDDRFLTSLWVNPQTDTVLLSAAGEGIHRRAAPPIMCFGQPATIVGTPGDDILNGTNGADVIVGLGGHDRINGRGGDDLICGGDGNDRLSGADGHDRITGQDGDDTIIGGALDDELWGGVGEDLLMGGGGNDHLHGQQDKDNLIGGWDDDTIWGGDGDDRILGQGDNDKLYGQDGNDVVAGGNGDDELWGGFGNDRLVGNDGNDTIGGNEGDDRLTGGNGDDELSGQSGSDRIYGHDGNDTLFGNDGFDVVSGGNGNDTLVGGLGNDRMWGGPGADQAWGGAGNDSAWGGDGDDMLDGQDGNDRLFGQLGSDWIGGGLGLDFCVGEVKIDCE